ncbi:MAG: BON domain-containing protein [Nibricoccus sp.]
MKALFFFLLGAAAGAYAYHYYLTKPATTTSGQAVAAGEPTTATTTEKSGSVTDRAVSKAESARDAIASKFAEWHLTPAEIRADLERTGQVVRTKAHAAGETIAAATSNARIIAMIKAKYTLDKELSARAIEVDCEAGQVTLRGNVANTELIAKAVAIAMDTDGVVKVKSLLTAPSGQG